MGNEAHYQLEHDLEALIKTLPEADLRRRLAVFVAESPVVTVQWLAGALGLTEG